MLRWLRWPLQAICVATALLFAGCAPTEARRAPGAPLANALDAPWLGQPGGVHGADLARLAALGQRDPEVTALFAEATRELGGSFETVAAHISICPPSVTQEGGLTRIEGYNLIVGRPVQELLAGAASPTADAALQALKAPRRTSRRFDEVDIVRFELVLLPRICFLERLTVGQAYETVVHELVHALHYDPYQVRAIAMSAPDELTFVRRVALAPGGEVDAYTVATRARLRLRGGHDRSPLLAVLGRASPTSMTREMIADAILAPRPLGLGYAAGLLRGKYQEVIAKERETLSEERELYTKLLEQRRDFATYLAKRDEAEQQNVRAFEHNIEVAKARNDAGRLAEAMRGRAETQANIARTPAMKELASASIERLSNRVADIEHRLAALPLTSP